MESAIETTRPTAPEGRTTHPARGTPSMRLLRIPANRSGVRRLTGKCPATC